MTTSDIVDRNYHNEKKGNGEHEKTDSFITGGSSGLVPCGLRWQFPKRRWKFRCIRWKYLPSDVLASIDTDETPEITFIGKITDVSSAEGYYEGGAVIIKFGDAELVELHNATDN